MKHWQRKHVPTIDVLKACYYFHNVNPSKAPWQILMKNTDAPEKVVYAAMWRDFDKGLLEYGVSLRTAWITEKGREYLKERMIKNGLLFTGKKSLDFIVRS